MAVHSGGMVVEDRNSDICLHLGNQYAVKIPVLLGEEADGIGNSWVGNECGIEYFVNVLDCSSSSSVRLEGVPSIVSR